VDDAFEMGDPSDAARASLIETFEELRLVEISSVAGLSDVRRRAFADGSDVVERSGVSQADGLVLLQEYAASVDQHLRERYPALFTQLVAA
jgi:hypothetical protein